MIEFDYSRLTPEKLEKIEIIQTLMPNDDNFREGLMWAVMSICTDSVVPNSTTLLKPLAVRFMQGYKEWILNNKD